MLFIFDRPDIYHFWMKNCRISLDMIWLDQNKRIISLTSNAPPCLGDPCPTYYPGEKALYVIETVAGFANEHEMKSGLTVKFYPFLLRFARSTPSTLRVPDLFEMSGVVCITTKFRTPSFPPW
jgi:uncharacterized membrane protein (UPF0127 family)